MAAKKKMQRKTYTVEQILDYMDCSLCYHLKYEKKVELPKETFVQNKNLIYKECLEETMYFYYLQHQLGQPPTLKKVYDKFYTLWMERTDTLDKNSILTRPLEEAGKDARAERSKFVTKGYESLKHFYAENAKKKQAVLAVNHPFEIVLEGAIITGSFDLIREVMGKESKRREIEVVSFQTSKRKPDEETLKHDFALTVMHYAFYEMFKTQPDNFVLAYVNRNEEILIMRGMEEYKRMIAIIESFIYSVENIRPYPRPGAHLVYSPYKTHCDNYIY